MATLWYPEPRMGRSVAGAAWAALCATLMLLHVPARAADSDADEARRSAEEARLEKVRGEIRDLEERLRTTQARAGSVLDSLEEIELRQALLRREAEALRQEERGALEEESRCRIEAAAIGSRVEASQHDLRRWLAEAYKAGPARDARVLWVSSSPSQFAAARRAVEALSLEQARRIDSYRADRERLDRVLEELGRKRARIADLRREVAARETDLGRGRRQKETILSGLKREEASQRRAISDLSQVETEIRSLLETLARPGGEGRIPSLGFARFRGLLSWPLKGRLAIPFGNVRHPRFSTIVPHPGVDIAAPSGQDVRAVYDGRVVFSDWFKGYGEMVVIDHGDGYLSIYGHVSERLVTPGQDVHQGDPIARSGEGGSFDGAGLYFEIRHDGKPEDPARWLKGRPDRVVSRRESSRDGGPAARGRP
jgi:septal ring factor EnvC (AmiA/AmiB activator)